VAFLFIIALSLGLVAYRFAGLYLDCLSASEKAVFYATQSKQFRPTVYGKQQLGGCSAV